MHARTLFAALALVLFGVGGATFADPPHGTDYSDATPIYRFFPGDEIDVRITSAPDLSRSVIVAPDGRIALPMIEPVRAAERTEGELETALQLAYAPFLRMPEIDVVAKTYASQQVFVGGEVARPGVYSMPGAIDALQAITLAGGFLPGAKRDGVLVLSRAGGGNDVRRINLSGSAIRTAPGDSTALSRYDVIYVPRSRVAQMGLFMQQYVRDALPVQFSLYYDLNSSYR
jgi:protein involved in polysaccharide export with SLBB domain